MTGLLLLPLKQQGHRLKRKLIMSLTGEKRREGLLIKGKDPHLLPKDAALLPYRPSVSGFGSDQNIHSTENVDCRPMHNSIWDKSLQNQVPFFVLC